MPNLLHPIPPPIPHEAAGILHNMVTAAAMAHRDTVKAIAAAAITTEVAAPNQLYT